MTPKKSLHVVLIVFLICINALVMAFMGFTLHQQKSLFENRAKTQVTNTVHTVEEHLNGSIKAIDLALKNVAYYIEHPTSAEGTDSRLIQQFMTAQERNIPEIEGLRVTDENGLIIIGNGVKFQDKVHTRDRDYYQVLKSDPNASLFITKPVWGKVVQHYIVVMARRYNYLPDVEEC